jgi:hypothetical protein
MKRLPFLETYDGENLTTIPGLKKKVEEVQLINLKLSEDIERLESMLKLQSGINKDLHKELETVVHKCDKDKKEILQRADDFEELSLRRLEKIHSLEAQLRQFVYGVSKTSKRHITVGPGGTVEPAGGELDVQSTIGEDNALLSELVDEKGGDLMPDENLLEIWIKDATLRDGIVVPGASTFMVIDFFDYESQTTSLMTGRRPNWDFAATFRVSVDDFLLRYLATDVVTLELNLVRLTLIHNSYWW